MTSTLPSDSFSTVGANTGLTSLSNSFNSGDTEGEEGGLLRRRRILRTLYLDTASAVVTKPMMGSVLSSQAVAPEEEECFLSCCHHGQMVMVGPTTLKLMNE